MRGGSILSTTLLTFSTVHSIDQDQSIRFGENRCAVKFGTGYNSGDTVLIKSCAGLNSQNKHKKGKFQWEFNENTEQIVSVGSKLSSSSSYCWTLAKYVGTTRSFDYSQRVYVEVCDENNVQQKFKISEDGSINVADKDWSFLCAGPDSENDDILTFYRCQEPEVEEVAQVVAPQAAAVNPETGLNHKFTQQQEALRLMAIVNANKLANKAKIKAEELVVEGNKAAHQNTKWTRKDNHAAFVQDFRSRKWAEKVEVNCKKRENQARQLGSVFTRPCDRGTPCNTIDATAECHNTWDCEEVYCDCSDEFFGETCSHDNLCNDAPCQNDSKCEMNEDGQDYTCECLADFTGKDCEIQIPCTLDPCFNSTCTDSGDYLDFSCDCPSDYTGKSCNIPIPCEHTDCNFGSCSNNEGFANFEDFTCTCDADYTGVNCDIPLPCAANPCENDSICNNSEDFTTYACTCSDDWYGETCNIASACNPVNNPCQNSATCTNSADKLIATCECAEGTTGEVCADFYYCWSIVCQNNGNCTDTIADDTSGPYYSGFECSCTDEFVGDHCQFSNLCLGNTDCLAGVCTHNEAYDDTYCDCPPGYSGDFCENAPLDCSAAGACNGQGCIDRTDGSGFDCHCGPEFTGDQCETGPLPCGCETDTFEIIEYSSTLPKVDGSSGSLDPDGIIDPDFSNWVLIPGGIQEDQEAFTDGSSNFQFRWRNVPSYLASENCYTMKPVARQNDCGPGCGHGVQNFTVKWINSCETSFYVWGAAFFLGSEDFTGGFRDNVPEGWTQLQDGTESNADHFKLMFDGNFQIPTNILNKVTVAAGINEITFPVEDLWVGGLAICREESGPCGDLGTCENSATNDFYSCT